MEFRPCIDIHNGLVKQIIGDTINDKSESAKENFVSKRDAAYYAELYKELNLKGGHVIILNSRDSEYYEASKNQALAALRTYRGGLQIGGGVTAENAPEYINAGASHVIVTSYIFSDGRLNLDNLKRLYDAVGREHIVIDLSCRRKNGDYYVVTDRWQKFTDMVVDEKLFKMLSPYCDEFLVHAVSVEGTGLGIDSDVLCILSKLPYIVTYAGGISCMEDIDDIRTIGRGNVNFTVGSRLDIFGGDLSIRGICACTQ